MNDVVTYTIKYLISLVGKKSGHEQSRAHVSLYQNHKPYAADLLYVVSFPRSFCGSRSQLKSQPSNRWDGGR